MKLLITCFSIKESGPVFTLGVAKALVNNGVDVYAILPANIENYQEWTQILEKNHLCGIRSNLEIKKDPFNSIQSLLKINHFFKGIKFDFFFDTFPNGKSNKINYFIKAKNYVGIWHDVVPHSSTSNDSSNRVFDTLKKMDGIVVLSKDFVNLAEKSFPQKKIIHLKHGAMEYPANMKKNEYKDSYDINYLYFGRIDGYKGLHVLSKAYSNLVEKHENISLTVAGGGDFSEYENEYAILPNCTVVNKYLTDDDIAYYFSKPNTVVVLPYLDATQSGVIGIALNYRTPVIVSDTGGLKEQLFNGEMGLFVTPNDYLDLEEKMEKFIIDKDLFKDQVSLMEIGYTKSSWDYVVKEFICELAEVFG